MTASTLPDGPVVTALAVPSVLQPQPSAADPAPTIRILIVDDRAQVRHELRTVLPLAGELAGLPVEIVGEARDGQEAVELAKALGPELILMDLEMPVLDGYAATRQIKAILPSIRVIALTVHDEALARRLATQAGIDGFIVKGEPIRGIIQTIHSII